MALRSPKISGIFWETSPKHPETFRAGKAILSSSVSKNGELYAPETSCMRRTSVHFKNMWLKQLYNRKVRDFAMTLRARKVSGSFEKRKFEFQITIWHNNNICRAQKQAIVASEFGWGIQSLLRQPGYFIRQPFAFTSIQRTAIVRFFEQIMSADKLIRAYFFPKMAAIGTRAYPHYWTEAIRIKYMYFHELRTVYTPVGFIAAYLR